MRAFFSLLLALVLIGLPAVAIARAMPQVQALPAATADANSDNDTKRVASVERRDFRIESELSGRFVPGESESIQIWPEEYAGEWLFLEVKEHGSTVREGEIIARFATRSIDEQIESAERALASAKLEHELGEQRQRLQLAAEQERLEQSERELERARRSWEAWQKFELDFIQRGQQLASRYTADAIEDQQDELEQLEAMYREDELTDATEEIVLKRSRRGLDRSKSSQKLEEDRRSYQRRFELEETKQRKQEGVRAKETALQRQVKTMELDRVSREDGRKQARHALERKVERLERLRQDREWFELRAPRSGLLLHGAAKDYEPGQAAPRHRRGGHAGKRVDLFTIADPESLALVLHVSESQIGNVHSGLSVTATPTTAPNKSVHGRLRVARFPASGSPDNTYRGYVAFDDHLAGVYPGMSAAVAVTTEELDSVLVAPTAAIVHEGGSSFAYVETTPDTFERTAVELGPQSRGEVVLLSGVRSGQRLLLQGAQQ